MMNLKFSATALTAIVVGLLSISIGVSPADAAKKRRYDSRSTSGNPNSSYMAGPSTRIYVTKRSWLDMGTEVLPGDRKYTDYAIGPGMAPLDHPNSHAEFRRQPLPDPFDLPGYPKYGYGGYINNY
jgi:hypothetical protein